MDGMSYIESEAASSIGVSLPFLPATRIAKRYPTSNASFRGPVIAGQVTGPAARLHRQPSEVERRFKKLSTKWKAETILMSSVEDMAMNRNYQRIIGMGPAVVPFILKSMKTKPDFWFWALRAITGADPVSKENLGDLQKMSAAWLKWGAAKGYSV